jgi:hypothetical protein
MLSIPITNNITWNDICIALLTRLHNNPGDIQSYLNILSNLSNLSVPDDVSTFLLINCIFPEVWKCERFS